MPTSKRAAPAAAASSAKRRKGAQRGKTPGAARCGHIPEDLLFNIIRHLAPNQRGLLLFSMVCRGARDAVLGDHKMARDIWYGILRATEVQHFRRFSSWWSSMTSGHHFGPPVVRDIIMGPYPNFQVVQGFSTVSVGRGNPDWARLVSDWPVVDRPPLRQEPFNDAEVSTLVRFAVRRARVEAWRACGFCGSRVDIVPVWGLGRKVCSACLKHNLVSAAALVLEFGFDYTAHMAEIAGHVYFFRMTDRRFIQYHLSHNPVDFAPENRCNSAHNVFFWRPHLERVVDLAECKRGHRERSESARVVQAAARALFVRLGLMQRGGCLTSFTNARFYLLARGKPANFPQSYVGIYSEAPLSREDACFVERNLPPHHRVRLCSPDELRARSMLQAAFLALRGRMLLPYAKKPAAALERLRTHEAVRGEMVHKAHVQFRGDGALFRQWRDMPTLEEG